MFPNVGKLGKILYRMNMGLNLGYVYIVSDHFASDTKTIPDRASVYT